MIFHTQKARSAEMERVMFIGILNLTGTAINKAGRDFGPACPDDIARFSDCFFMDCFSGSRENLTGQHRNPGESVRFPDFHSVQ